MKKRRLSKEENALWKRATREVRPISDTAPPLGLPLGESQPGGALPSFAGKTPPQPPSGNEHAHRKAAGKPAPASSAFNAGDPGLDRRVKRGRMAVDRTLDLHGLTQVAARVRLAAFLEKAHMDGCRCVLVITGKGAPDAERSSPFQMPSRSHPRGIIRQRFQDWINEDALRPIVARAAPAAPKDGGAGAFYVFLKRRGGRL